MDRGTVNGLQLHSALLEALDPELTVSDYYRYHPWREDGGYLRSLVSVCRRECLRLPSYRAVRPFLLSEAKRAQVLALNHEPDHTQRNLELKRWALREFPSESRVSWFELSAAASAGLTIYALLILASKPQVSIAEIERVHRAYSPWISATATMLDSYVDQDEDEANGEHSYVAHYRSAKPALHVGRLVRRSMSEAGALPDGERHVLIVASMAAMYLSKDSANSTEMRDQTRALVGAGGPLARLLFPLLSLWRIYHERVRSVV